MCRFVNVLLPHAARQEGVRVRWWQPTHEGSDHSDWALDNVLIAGSDPRAQISDTFGGVALPNHERAPADGTPTGRIGLLNEGEEESTSGIYTGDLDETTTYTTTGTYTSTGIYTTTCTYTVGGGSFSHTGPNSDLSDY